VSKYDAARQRRQELMRLMHKHGMVHPDYFTWEAEFKRLGKITGKPRNQIATRCEEPRGYPPVQNGRDWQKPEHVNPVQTLRKGGRL